MATDTGFGIVRFFDDFLGDTIEVGPWTEASNNSATKFAIALAVNGTVKGIVTNESGDGLSVMYGALNWEADDAGPLTFEARVKIVTDLSQLVYAGFSDQATTERPMDYNGGTLQTAADNAVGFYYAGGETDATWRCGGTKSTVDSTQTAASSIYDPVEGEWQTLRVVLDENGNGSFYINGNIIIENVSGCVTKGTSLMPYFSETDDGAAGEYHVDYCYVSKGRV